MKEEIKKYWKSGNHVNCTVSHERRDADEHFIFAINLVFPEVVAKTFPSIGAATMGSISIDAHLTEGGPGGPHTIFIGVGKGPRRDIFDEHDEINGKECAATKMVRRLRLNKIQRQAIKASLTMVLYEDKNGTEVAYEIPGMVKQLHDTCVYSEKEVLNWCALAYAAQIKEDFELATLGKLPKFDTNKKGWQLCVGSAFTLIQKHFGESEAEYWLEMAGTAMSFTVTLKEAAVVEIERVRKGDNLFQGEQSIWLEKTRGGDVPLLAIVTENRQVQNVAMNQKGYGIVVIKTPTDNVHIAMDRRKKWCSCDICARLREAENKVRNLRPLSGVERYSHDSVLACPQWNRFQEAPYVTNGTLKHSNVEPTVLPLAQIVRIVEKGVRGHFHCPDWNQHGWLQRVDTDEVGEKKRKEKVKATEKVVNENLVVMEHMFLEYDKAVAEVATVTENQNS